MTDRQDDFARGVRNRRAMLGDEWVDRSLGNANAFNADFQAFITRYAWNDIWGRPGLEPTTRRLLVLATTLALGRWEEFELHCRAAIRGGVDLSLIQETLMQGAIYAGVPAANTAFKLTMDILRAEGKLPPSRPLTADARTEVHHTFSAPQLRIAVEGTTEGRTPVVLAHALGLDHTMWDGVAAHLAPTRAVLRYDARGHGGPGGSAVPDGPATMDQLVDDAARVIREWGRGPVVFVGLSMGGMVGQGLAIRHPDLVRGVVLANTTAHYPQVAQAAWAQRIEKVEAGGLEAIADMAMERYFSEAFRRDEAAQVAAARATLLRTSPQGYVAGCQAVRAVDWLAELPTVACPALVIAGALDVGATPEMGKAIAERIPGAEFMVIEGAAHLSAVETPAAFLQAVDRFLAKVDAAG